MFWKRKFPQTSFFSDALTNLASWSTKSCQRSLGIHPLIESIVQQISNDLLRCGFSVRFQGVDQATEKSFSMRLQERFLQLNLSKQLFEWTKQSFLSPNGALLLFVSPRDTNWSAPLNLDSLAFIEQIRVVPGHMFSPTFVNDSNPLEKDFQKPQFIICGKSVHSSRALWCNPNQSGQSLSKSLSSPALAFDSALEAAQRLLERVGALLLESDELRIDRNSPAVIQQLLVHIRDNLKSNGALGLRKGDKLSLLSFENLSHFPHIYEFLLDSISMISGVPRILLVGHQKSSLGSGRAHHEELIAYFQRIHGLQERLLVSSLSYLIFVLLHESSGILADLSSSKYSFSLEFHPLESLDPLVQSQLKLHRSQIHASDISSGKISPQEARLLDPLYSHLDSLSTPLGTRPQS